MRHTLTTPKAQKHWFDAVLQASVVEAKKGKTVTGKITTIKFSDGNVESHITGEGPDSAAMMHDIFTKVADSQTRGLHLVVRSRDRVVVCPQQMTITPWVRPARPAA